MKVHLKFELDCEPEAALEALQSPDVFQDVSAPFTTFIPLERGGFPEKWTPGPHPAYGMAFGIIPIGKQIITIDVLDEPHDVRVVRDSGGGVSGVLGLITTWEHRMAVSPLPDGRTLYRDQLTFGAGRLTPFVGIGLWAFWQYRGARIRMLSKEW
jgi:hypothetical protein